MENFKERLLFLWDGAKPAHIAKDLNLSISGMMRILEKNTIPKAETLILIQNLKKCDWQWLMTGEGEPFPAQPQEISLADNIARTDKLVRQLAAQKRQNRQPETAEYCDTQGNPVNVDDFVFIPYYDVRLSAGTGVWVDDEQPVNTLAFRADWLRTFVTAQFDRLSVVKVSGDSMDDVLKNNDTILINHTQNEVHDGLYALRIGNEVFVKHIQRLPHKLQIISANPTYPPFELSTDDDFAIIGKVVWLGRLL